MSVYGLVAACLSIVAVVVALLLSYSSLRGKDPRTAGALYNFLDLNGSKFEILLKAFYISFTVYYVLMLPTAFTAYSGFLVGFKNLVQMLLVNVIGTRIVFEGLMLVYRTYVQVVALNKHLGVKAPEMEPMYQQPAAPVAQPVQQTAVPVSQPVAQPVTPVAVPVPTPVAPAPVAEEPVTNFAAPTAPVPEPVAPAAPVSGPRVCLGCGKPVKDGIKFCPYCGTNQ